ncbi:hypothetical protein PIB30_059105 [Stylosanthes scabra]|uniref:Uncharacterized protein n=1 Tax=Stylosanthes scabra TaxID=79078 RepID=A0ABU6YLC5_9FABA|nr:hypothetical protein [Stylosanthes scabra]
MDSSANAMDENLDHCQETFGAAEVDYVNVIELLDGSLDVGIDDVDVGEVAVDGDGETHNVGGSEGVDHVRRLDACHTFEEVMAMEFESPETVVQNDGGVWVAQWIKHSYMWDNYVMEVTDWTRMQIALELVMGKNNPKANEVCSLAIRTWDKKVRQARAKLNPRNNKRKTRKQIKFN